MASNTSNDKSRQISIRIPHDVLDEIDTVKASGESTAAFLVLAAKGEIARRQLKENGEEKLLTNLNGALEALERIGEIGAQAGDHLRELVGIAQHEARQLKGDK